MKQRLLLALKSVTFALGLLFSTQMMAEDVLLTALSGTSGYSGEDYPMLVDGSRSTKWCMGGFKGAYIIFKGDHAFIPTSYTLITGLDTKTTPQRNWKTWKVFAANFENDEAATRDADAWTLLISASSSPRQSSLPKTTFLQALPARRIQQRNISTLRLNWRRL